MSGEPTAADLGEFGLIARLQQRFARGGAGIVRGIGDDAAALQPSPGQLLLVTTDAALEGVHFRTATTTPTALGRRALAVNLSDIAAMAGTPRWALVSFGFPATTPVAFVDGLADGLAEEAGLYATEIIGGNIARSPDRIVISITVLGEVPPEQVVYRTGARPGDRLLATGTLGDSAAGL
ncbi:MAG TPA: AIR synthase related protein, partial [Chloroflexota bacterium]|nr:AIR synthase related protein [Chloroflexota bacterium]